MGRMEFPARSFALLSVWNFVCRVSTAHWYWRPTKCSHQSRSAGCMEFDYVRVRVAKQKVIELISSHFYSFCCEESNWDQCLIYLSLLFVSLESHIVFYHFRFCCRVRPYVSTYHKKVTVGRSVRLEKRNSGTKLTKKQIIAFEFIEMENQRRCCCLSNIRRSPFNRMAVVFAISKNNLPTSTFQRELS